VSSRASGGGSNLVPTRGPSDDTTPPQRIQICVCRDRLTLWNPAVLPEGWTFATLLGEHPSIPYNPNVFENPSVQEWIASHIDAAIAECWVGELEGRLKPLMVYLADGAPAELDYTQLRLAVVRRARAGGASGANGDA